MIKDNRGYSFIELVIVVAIISILAGVSVLTFNAANGAQPSKTKDNLVYSAKYAKSLVQAQDKEYCVAIIKASQDAGNEYYAIYGTATGDSESASEADNQIALRSTFKSQHLVDQTTDAGSTEETKTVNDSSQGYSLDYLIDHPTEAQSCQRLGNRTTVSYEGTDIIANSTTAVIIKFSKFDGRALTGAGTFEFKQGSSDNVKCKCILNKDTGVFRDVKVN